MKLINLRLRSLLWAVIVYQLILWLAEYWLAETVTATSYTLLAALVIQLLIPRHWSKYLLQMGATFVVNLTLFANSRPDSLGASALYNESWNAIVSIHPYIWYSLVTACMFALFTDWASTKKRTSYIVLTIVVALCVIDSFSLVIVWSYIATTVICGLLLIAVLHFTEFKQKYPESWEHLKERPGSILFPLAILLSIMLFVGMQAPTLSPFLTDPYTAWKNAQGETVEKLGKGVDSPSLTSRSGYGRDNSVLGGSFLYDHSPVMTVESTKRAYWRGESLDVYDGQGWTKSETFQLRVHGGVRSSSTGLTSSEQWDQSLLETETIQYSITMLTDNTYPVLFAAFHPERLQLINGTNHFPEGIYWDSRRQQLEWTRANISSTDMDSEAVNYPETYSLTSQVPVLDEDELRMAYENQMVEDVTLDSYVQLPSDLPNRVRQLALEVTAEAATVYDQVKSVEAYLKNEFVYTSMPDESVANSEDFVDRFLFEIKEGYCDYFSTSMVVMLRTLGIPARWVKGFAPGESDALADWDYYEGLPSEELINGPGTYTVRNSNAHSWVEVYFPGYGWLPFEPTPGFTLTHGSADGVEASGPQFPLPPVDSEHMESEDIAEQSGSAFSINGKWIVAGLAMLILIAIVIYVMMRYGVSSRQATVFFKKNTIDQAVIVKVDRFLHYATKKGLPRDDHETLREWTKKWATEYTGLSESLHELLALFEKAKYTPRSLGKEEIARVSELIKLLRKQIASIR